ncbi:MAG: LamG-like jellyroll fold domain-containing protein, partial [Rhodospirillales bacterium]
MSANSVFQSGSNAFTMEGWINTSLNSSAIQTIFSVGSTSATQSLINSSFANSSGLSLTGNATVTGGALQLTSAANNQSGVATINPSGNAEGARNFTASFDLKMGESTSQNPADGFSFSYGNTTFSGGSVQEGITDGLTIAFDTFVNGGETINGIDVILNGTVVQSYVVTGGTRTSKSTHAAEFDGADDILSRGLDTALHQNGDVTVEAWIKPSAYASSGSEVSIVAIGGPSGDANAPDNNFLFILQMTDDGHIRMLHEDSDRLPGSPGANQEVLFDHPAPAIALNEWTHVAVSREISGEGGTYSLYINGQFVVSDTYEYDPDGNGSSAELTIGGELVDGGGIQAEFTGQIDDVRIWDDVRTSSEISANYNKEITSSGANLIANYTFDNSLTADESSHDGSQTLTNSGVSRVAITDSKIEAEFVNVTITHNDNGLTVTYDGFTEISNLVLDANYAPQDSDVFTLAASTGSENDLHAVDNLVITATDLGTRNAIAVQNGKLVFVTEETYGSAAGNAANPTITDSGTTV